MRARLAGRQASRRHADAGLDQVGPLQREPGDDVAAARMADQVVGLLAELIEEGDGVLHDGVHGVVGVGLRIVGVALAELVEGDDVVPGLEHRKVERPGPGGARAVAWRRTARRGSSRCVRLRPGRNSACGCRRRRATSPRPCRRWRDSSCGRPRPAFPSCVQLPWATPSMNSVTTRLNSAARSRKL